MVPESMVVDVVAAPVAPLLLKLKDAAVALGNISLSKLKKLIRAGEVASVMLGGMRMVPTSELQRIATPLPQPAAQLDEAEPETTAAEEAAKLRAIRSARRKR